MEEQKKEEPQESNGKRGGKRIIISVAFAVVVIIGVICIIALGNTPERRFRKQLDTGNRFLEEMEYEKAIAAYEAAIKIDPMSAEAYLGMAQAYVGLGEYEQAISILERGYELTQDGVLMTYRDEVIALIGRAVIPTWEGKKQQDFLKELEEAGLKYEVSLQTSMELPEMVIDCTPAAGTEISKRDVVRVTVSSGLEYDPNGKYVVDDLRGKSMDNARKLLAEHGIYMIEGEGAYDDEVAKGLIAVQDAKQGETINAGSVITVGASFGEELFEVPALVGKTSEEAAKLLEDKNLQIKVNVVAKTDVEDGKVFEQSVAAGSMVSKQTEITVSVSQKVLMIPDLAGKTRSEAESICVQNGIKISFVEVLGDEDKVIAQSPASGSTISPEETVTIRVGISNEAFKKAMIDRLNELKKKSGKQERYVEDARLKAGAEKLLNSTLAQDYYGCDTWGDKYYADWAVIKNVKGYSVQELFTEDGAMVNELDYLIGYSYYQIGIAFKGKDLGIVAAGELQPYTTEDIVGHVDEMHR